MVSLSTQGWFVQTPLLCNLSPIDPTADTATLAVSIAAVATPALFLLLESHRVLYSSSRLDYHPISAIFIVLAVSASLFHASQAAIARSCFLIAVPASVLLLSGFAIATVWQSFVSFQGNKRIPVDLVNWKSEARYSTFKILVLLIFGAAFVFAAADVLTPVGTFTADPVASNQNAWNLCHLCALLLCPVAFVALIFNLAKCHGAAICNGNAQDSGIRYLNVGVLLFGAAVGVMVLAESPCSAASPAWTRTIVGMHALFYAVCAYALHLTLCGLGCFRLMVAGHQPYFVGGIIGTILPRIVCRTAFTDDFGQRKMIFDSLTQCHDETVADDEMPGQVKSDAVDEQPAEDEVQLDVDLPVSSSQHIFPSFTTRTNLNRPLNSPSAERRLRNDRIHAPMNPSIQRAIERANAALAQSNQDHAEE